jgi:hypothetical protein
MNLRQVYESLACHLRINLSKDRIYLFNGETGDRLRYWKRFRPARGQCFNPLKVFPSLRGARCGPY